ncbi:hypothetical protein EcWSU1_03676 [Enterobacter ludwigii]|uniref:Uncharacterized protein n=1 Tax=Enterobacter ludwigii TaxID=299767 RepID=G8LD98_9ENTR|nr:hypothetical protein EcWSU1_03676 [Enterobacter ludwigii]
MISGDYIGCWRETLLNQIHSNIHQMNVHNSTLIVRE